MDDQWYIWLSTFQLPAYTSAAKVSPLDWNDAVITVLVLLSVAGEYVADNQQWGALGISNMKKFTKYSGHIRYSVPQVQEHRERQLCQGMAWFPYWTWCCRPKTWFPYKGSVGVFSTSKCSMWTWASRIPLIHNQILISLKRSYFRTYLALHVTLPDPLEQAHYP